MSSRGTDGEARRVVVLHGGVTFRNRQNLVDACKNVMKSSDGAVEAVENLEHCGSFNAGRGSCLTREGAAEMEAAVYRMDKEGEVSFGAVGAATRLVSPVRVAEAIADSRCEQEQTLKQGLVDPMVIVGDGAEKWAEDHGLKSLVLAARPARTPEAEKEWRRAQQLFIFKENSHNFVDESLLRAMDTVGAVELNLGDWSSTVACSSGGIILKRPGRLGHCTVFGSGMWVEAREWHESSHLRRRLVSLCLTGCGEAIVRLDAARTLARRIAERCDSTPIPEVISAFYKEQFHKGNRLLRQVNDAHLYMGGVAIVREEKRRKGKHVPLINLEPEDGEDVMSSEDDEEDSLELFAFHDTPFLPVAWRDERGKVCAMMSKRDADTEAVTVTVMPL